MSLSLHTARLTLDGLRPDDATALLAIRTDPSVATYQGWVPGDLDEVRAFIAAQAAASEAPGRWRQLALRRSSDGLLLGDLGLRLHDEGRQAEVGCTLAPAHQGQGYATEAVACLLDHLVHDLGLHRVHASVDPRNVPACALMERLGFRREAHHRQSLWWRGGWVDDVIFAMLAAEFPRQPRHASRI